MCFNKRIVGVLFALTIITVVHAAEEPQHPLAENEFVLRSCMSSVDLDTRKIDGVNSRLEKTENNRVSKLPTTQSLELRHAGKSGGTKNRRARPGRKMIADTPLLTLNVERRGRQEVPQIFVKKEQLPEIKSSLSDGRREKKNEASIIVIESARQFPSDS